MLSTETSRFSAGPSLGDCVFLRLLFLSILLCFSLQDPRVAYETRVRLSLMAKWSASGNRGTFSHLASYQDWRATSPVEGALGTPGGAPADSCTVSHTLCTWVSRLQRQSPSVRPPTSTRMICPYPLLGFSQVTVWSRGLQTFIAGFPGGGSAEPACQCRKCETRVWSLGGEGPLEEGMATHSSILAWRIPMDRGSWQAMVHRVTNSWTRLKGLCELLQHLLTALGWEPLDFTTPSANLLFSRPFPLLDRTSVLGKVPWGFRCTLAPMSSTNACELVSGQQALECGLLWALQA